MVMMLEVNILLSQLFFTIHLLLLFNICAPDDQVRDDEEGEGIVLGGGAAATRYPWEGTDRDYKYEEVLNTPCSNLFVNQLMDHGCYRKLA
jgi:hypothetical protein